MECVFVGAGAIAAEYAESVADSELTVTGVCDLREARARAVAQQVDAQAYTDIDELLAAESAPLVCTLTDHRSHAAITRRALDADRHVFSQKPLAMDGPEAARLVETAAERGLAVGCAPISPTNPAQRRVARLLADDRCGKIRLGYAHAHVGRVTEWHDRPESFLAVGPLYDGAVYPLTNLVSWFGPIERVRVADALDPWPDGQQRPSRPSHVEATLQFARGPAVRLTASFYTPHRSREFTTLELHGDDGSVYLGNAGALIDGPEMVQYGRLGADYVPVPPAAPTRDARLLDGPARLAAAIAAGDRPRRTAHRGVHVVRVCNAIERAAADGRSVAVDTDGCPSGIEADGWPVAVESGGRSVVGESGGRPTAVESAGRSAADESAGRSAVDESGDRSPVGDPDDRHTETAPVVAEPRVGITAPTADPRAAVARALDAGIRLVDLGDRPATAGEAVTARGGPARESLHLRGRLEPGETATEITDRLPFDRLDSLLVAGSRRIIARVEAARTANVADAVGIVADEPGEWLEQTDPAVVGCHTHPERPRRELVERCRALGVPVCATGRVPERVRHADCVQQAAADSGLRPTTVVHAWNAARGVIPQPPTEPAELLAVGRAASVLPTRVDEWGLGP